MRPMEEREKVLNMYFHEGRGYKDIAKTMDIPWNTVRTWCRRYRQNNDIPKRGKTPLTKEPINPQSIKTKKQKSKDEQDARIARLEMEVDLLRNFLILSEGE